ncbi:hypothetical protein Pla52o_13800 [Novipirellula galeiformis]|uniref:Uncharacterized protein n=1 Tax=Novipirellula galeiformis TaxID=2528004 RepID=A0A5C6CKY0_9BACT|nr:hypothetical protein Pla52o_13800 [Novipirellula galeiformis]
MGLGGISGRVSRFSPLPPLRLHASIAHALFDRLFDRVLFLATPVLPREPGRGAVVSIGTPRSCPNLARVAPAAPAITNLLNRTKRPFLNQLKET